MGEAETRERVSKTNIKYQPLYSTDKRYIILTGGRGSGKSHAVHEFISRLTYEKGHGILFTRYTMVSAEKSIIPEFVNTLVRLGITSDFSITKTRITNLRTGSFIFFSGIKTSKGDQTANLKSLPNITTWVIEEGEDYRDENSFIDIDDSIRKKGIQNRVIWIQNPSYADESFIYEKYFDGYEEDHTIEFKGIEFNYSTSTHPDVCHIHTTYLDNRDNLNQDKLEKWDHVAEEDWDLFNHKYIGAWLKNKEGALYLKSELTRFSMDQFNIDNVEARLSFNDPADRGTDSLSAPCGYVVGDRIFVTDWYFSTSNQDITIPELVAYQRSNQIEVMAIETNGGGLAYSEALRNVIGCNLIEVSQQANKHSRIISNSGFIRNYFVFRNDYESGSMYDKAMRELFAYNKDDKENRKNTLYNDDAPDSITGLWLLAKDLLKDRWL